jgi:endonuclease/exonuclease/phosphatase family metal-dependent hydrolase
MERLSRRVSARQLGVSAVALCVVAVLAGGLAACGTKQQASPQTKPMPLKVMEFNIEYGGTLVDFGKVVEAVKASDPDVVGIEEAETNIPRLAKALGWAYYSTGMQIVSKYPILEPSESGGAYAFVEVEKGKVAAISNVHLPSDPYGPYWVRDGKTVDQVLAMEREVRLPAIQKQLEVLPPLAKKGIPVFMVGDFNSPSYLDWTSAAAGTRKYLKYAVEWPVSKAVADAGFRDSWRDVYPDPVKDPGLTWWAPRPKVPEWASNPGPKDPQDRIDYVYAAGPSKTVASEIVGEQGGPEISIPISPWPSDHRAVMSTFEVTPGTMPVLVAVNAWLVTAGDELKVTVHAPGKGGEQVAVVTSGGDPRTGAIFPGRPIGAAGTTDGTVAIPTAGIKPGGYDAVLTTADGAVLARVPFWVRAKGAKTELTTDKRVYKAGEPIAVSWENAPANRWDWIGVYKAPANPANDSYLIWQYTGGATAGTLHGMPAGTLTLDGTAQGEPWPLPAGKYQVFYLLADAYTPAAKVSFMVTK